VEERKAIKNAAEVAGFESAYLRDGASMVRWYAWLDEKIAHGYEITEYEAAHRLTEFRSRSELYQGLAYENISACGPNAGRSYAAYSSREVLTHPDSASPLHPPST
jgi:Xaa-Pro aminopeptidase